MPSREENLHFWNTLYPWPEGGEEWSMPWGGSSLQWATTILPRIRPFLPCAHMLEIAPGYGRWTHYLLDHCEQYTGVELSDRCVVLLRERFRERPQAQFSVNDGASLAMVADQSIDFCFSFESLVHAEADVMESYLTELRRVLTPTGAAFLHHSNLGAQQDYFRRTATLPGWLRSGLNRLGLVDLDQWRAATMSAQRFQQLAEKADLYCATQETLNWGGRRMIDCFSVVRRQPCEHRLLANPDFLQEVLGWAALAPLYA
ncbi:MAG: class I SAM-dependent methyltransferase [Candidatus Eremiobacteraeota bacterium]|nr:class I SAM-dependent methyltransferase [Candidatus Eremiobacteraeota bacterium]